MRYATRILICLAQEKNKRLKTTELAAQTGISVHFINQITLKLQRAGVVNSLRGAKGGHILIKNPKEIDLAWLYTLMEGPVSLTPCSLDSPTCIRDGHCFAQKAWKKISKNLEKELRAISIATLSYSPQCLDSLMDEED